MGWDSTATKKPNTANDRYSGNDHTVLEEIELGLFTGFEDMTALEDKKSLTVFFRYSGHWLYK